jgi:hypothetical protein
MTQTLATRTELLEDLGNLPVDYIHRDRESTPGEPIVLANAVLKWNSVHVAGEPIPFEETEAARELVRSLGRAGELDVDQGLGFVVHHKSTAHAFVMIAFWHDKNELWQAVYYRQVSDPIDHFTKNSVEGRSLPFACVWELSPIWEERNAWSRYLKSARDLAAKQAWLADNYTGIA